MRARTALLCAVGVAISGCAPDTDGIRDTSPGAPGSLKYHGDIVEDPPAVTVVLPQLTDVEAGGRLGVQVVNERGISGSVVLSVFIESEAGGRRFESLLSADLPAWDTVDVDLPVDALGLPEDGLTLPGHIGLDVSLDYADGVTRRLSALPLYFRPLSAGRWEVYDHAEQMKRPAGGAWTAELREVLERVTRTRPGSQIVPAYRVPQPDVEALTAADSTSQPVDMPASDRPPSGTVPSEEEFIWAANSFLGLPTPPTNAAVKPEKVGPEDGRRSQSHNVTSRICVRVLTNYTDVGGAGGAVACADDDGTCEDDYATPGNVFRSVTGWHYQLIPAGSSSATASGFLGDGFNGNAQGCTPMLTLPHGTYTMVITTLMLVGDDNSANSFMYVSDELIGPNPVGLTVPNVSWPDSDGNLDVTPAFFGAPNVAQVVAWSVSMNPQLLPLGNGFNPHPIHVTDSGATGADCNDAELWIRRNDVQKKFTIAHELGHTIEAHSTGTFCGFAYDLTDTAPSPCQSNVGHSHAITSREFISGAALEGFANFYAAAAFNKRVTAADCWLQMSNKWIDCESNETHATAWMNTQCATPHSGRGNEIDWARQFWDVRTNLDNAPSMAAMLRWIRDANDSTAWTNSNHFTLLDNEANDTATHGTWLNSLWDGNKTTNGVVH